jgi:hypothetical protein
MKEHIVDEHGVVFGSIQNTKEINRLNLLKWLIERF